MAWLCCRWEEGRDGGFLSAAACWCRHGRSASLGGQGGVTHRSILWSCGIRCLEASVCMNACNFNCICMCVNACSYGWMYYVCMYASMCVSFMRPLCILPVSFVYPNVCIFSFFSAKFSCVSSFVLSPACHSPFLPPKLAWEGIHFICLLRKIFSQPCPLQKTSALFSFLSHLFFFSFLFPPFSHSNYLKLPFLHWFSVCFVPK